MNKTEELHKASQSMFFVIRDLKDANKRSNSVEHLLIIDLIEKATSLEKKIQQALNAMVVDTEKP